MSNYEMHENNAYKILDLSNEFVDELIEKAFKNDKDEKQSKVENLSKDKNYDIENAAKKRIIEKMQFLKMNLQDFSIDDLKKSIEELTSLCYAYSEISTDDKRIKYGFGNNIYDVVKDYLNRISSQVKLHGKTAFEINNRILSGSSAQKQYEDLNEQIKDNLYQYCERIIPRIIPDDEVSFRELTNKMDSISIDTLINSVRMLIEQIWAYEKINTKENREIYKAELVKVREKSNLER